MADRDQFQQPQFGHQLAEKSSNTSQILAVVTLFPLGAFLLLLAGLTLAATLIGLAITTPLFILFSPVLVPAALAIALAVTGFLTSGAFGVTGLSSLSWIINHIRQARGSVPDQMDYMKRRAGDVVGFLGQKTKDVGQDVQSRGQAVSGGGGGGVRSS
uniref:Oleosin n=1 Tax=Kalanchoe fedtschenkoi TaxID=63787 RepID=A0A7N0T604_KALFE